MGSGEPSLVVETTVAGLRVVSPEMHSFILLQSQFMCGWQGTTSAIPCSDARIFALLRTETSATHVRTSSSKLHGICKDCHFPCCPVTLPHQRACLSCNTWPPLAA